MKKVVYAILIFTFFCLVIAGCGGSQNSNSSQNPSASATPIPFTQGMYVISGTSSANASSNFTLAGSLTQSNNNLSGVMHIAIGSCFTFNTDIPVSGALSMNGAGASVVALNFNLPSGQMLSFNMTHPGGNLSSVSGTYTLTGAGCASTDQGSASGNILNVTNALWTGTSSGSGTAQLNANLKQTGPDAHGFFSATGTGTVTGGTCFSSFNVDAATVVSGPNSTLILDNTQAGSTGKTTLQGTFTPGAFGAATFTGTYTSTDTACSDSGTVQLSAP